MKSLQWLQKVAESLGGFRYVRTPIFNLDKALGSLIAGKTETICLNPILSRTRRIHRYGAFGKTNCNAIAETATARPPKFSPLVLES